MRNEVNKTIQIGRLQCWYYWWKAIYEVHCWDGLRWHYVHTESHDDQFRHSSNIEGITSTVWEAVVLVLLVRGIYNVRHWDGVSGMIFLPSIMKIGTGLQAILRFCLRNLRGSNVGITGGRDLWSVLLTWAQVAWYTYQVSWRLIKAFKQY
jgi:hypothetical protein